MFQKMAASGQTTKMADFTAVPSLDYCTTTMATMWQHQQDGLFTDVIIKVKDTAIPCHRLVLASASDYFAAVLTSASKEKKAGEIRFENLEPDVMLNILRFLYGQDATFKADSLSNVLEALQIIQIDSLKNQLSQYMCDNLSVENCLSWWKSASKFGMGDLRRTTTEMIFSNMTVVGASEEFKALTIEELGNVVKADDVALESTDGLLMACMEWVDYEPLARKGYMMDILKNMDLSKCGIKTLETIEKKYQDLLHDVSVYRIIVNELFQRIPESDDNAAKSMNKRLVLLGGWADGQPGKINIKCFVDRSVDGFKWEEFAEIPAAIHTNDLCIVVTNDGSVAVMTAGRRASMTPEVAHGRICLLVLLVE